MRAFINSSFHIGKLKLKNRLIQGPLAGYSCAPFRELFSAFTPPAYCVSEMLSAYNVVHKDTPEGRYLYRSPNESILCYQLSGKEPTIMEEAANRLQSLKANLIDINCGCPKTKIRKKGAGSALLEQPERLIGIIKAIKHSVNSPLTIKIRIQDQTKDTALVKAIADAGADALIVHGRRWVDDYGIPVNLKAIQHIKKSVTIPVIANGDISDANSLQYIYENTGCDAFMISRASTGKPWLFEELLTGQSVTVELAQLKLLFINHLKQLANLENEYQAVLQSKSLIRYYFDKQLDETTLATFYQLKNLAEIEYFIGYIISF